MSTKSWPVERRSPRSPAKVPAKLLVNSEDGNYVCKGEACDCSAHGLRIQITFPFLAVQQAVEVVLDGQPRRSVKCRVVWLGRPGTEYAGRVGLEYLTPVDFDCASH